MLDKVTGLAGALAVLVAIVTAFVPIAGLDVAVLLLVLGMVAGIGYDADATLRGGVATVALPLVAAAMGSLPALGTQVGAIFSGFAIAATGAFGVSVLIRVVQRSIGAVKGLAG